MNIENLKRVNWNGTPEYAEAGIWPAEKCPNFTGVKEHGSRMSFCFGPGSNVSDIFHIYEENISLNLYADGYICVLASHYDWNLEEWDEETVLTFEDSDKTQVISMIDRMLNFHPAASLGKRVESYDSALNILKNI